MITTAELAQIIDALYTKDCRILHCAKCGQLMAVHISFAAHIERRKPPWETHCYSCAYPKDRLLSPQNMSDF